MIIPCFSLELLDIHAVEIDEKHVVHQVGFLCLALIMCVYQMTAYVLYEKKVTWYAAIQYPSYLFFSLTEKQLQTEIKG